MSDMRHVSVLIESSRAFGRGLIEGVARWIRERGNWSTYFEPRDLASPAPRWLRSWKGDGILVRLDSHEMLEEVLATGVPAVDVRRNLIDSPLPQVGGDNPRMIQIAFEHFVSAGLTNFGFCGIPVGIDRFMDLRRSSFFGLVEQSGSVVHSFDVQEDRDRRITDWEREIDRLAEWIRSLPTPIGILACDDHHGLQVLDACRRAGVPVPDEIAVVGINNDPVICQLAFPPMSSVDPGGPRIGYAAAACLDNLMSGGKPPPEPLVIEPTGLVVRQSSDMVAIDDPELARAVRFIRQHACSGIRIRDILDEVPLSRSVLERKFRSLLNRTPHAEIQRIRIARARQLLLESDLSLRDIAECTGFSGEKYFSDAFHRETGVRPGAFRRTHGRSGAKALLRQL